MVAVGAGFLAASLATPSAKVPSIESAWLNPGSYRLSVEHGDIALSGGPGADDCAAQLFDPASLRSVRTLGSCPTGASSRGSLIVRYVGMEVALHVEVKNARTGSAAAGPLVMTLSSWGWSHSGVATGDGSVWIFGLDSKTLVRASTKTGRVENRWHVNVGADPWMAVDADGFWMTSGVWGGEPFCPGTCGLWHVAPGSNQLTVARRLSDGTEWFSASGHSLYLDELRSVRGGYQQSMWRLAGPDATVAYRTPATLLPAPDFGGTGYAVVGDPHLGFFTLSQLGAGGTPTGIGDCDASAPMRIVRIDPGTGRESYVATLPELDDGNVPECDVQGPGQALIYRSALYLLSDPTAPGVEFGSLVRVSL